MAHPILDKPFPHWVTGSIEYDPANIEMTEKGWVYHHNDGYDEVIVAIAKGLTKRNALLGGGDETSPNFEFTGGGETTPDFVF
jgi:hypothetical protein